MRFTIPKEIKDIADVLEKAGYRAYLVGGSVRDLLLSREPKDWDIATDAKPDEVQKLFFTFAKATADKPATIYENQFGTVGVKTSSEDERLKVVEITTFRIEGKYTDKRHPDEIKFAETIEEDLSRRDFTVNALALSFVEGIAGEIIDPHGGQKDLKEKIIRTVGNPRERFSEDALRLMRVVRLAAELGFKVDKETAKAIQDEAGLLEMIAKERIREELVKIIMTLRAATGIVMLEDYKLLRYIMPELREGIGCGQNKHHIYTVFDHNVRALNYTAEKKYPFHIRLAALLHDVGKPRTKRGEGPNSTFYNHEVVGAKLTIKILDRLHFSKDIVEKVAHLVRSHLFYYNVGEVTEGGVRRFLRRVGPENVDDLIKVREADRIGSGVPKAVPYKIRHLLFMVEKVKNDPISPKMLKVDGGDVMRVLGIKPGPEIGQILSILLEEILDDPSKNTSEHLELRLSELGKLKEDKLSELSRRAQERKEEFESGVEREIKKKYYVK
ncbi:MAG: CCA tRNA nucleotidyltransferase [Patescibacteria group bacterium]|nr:CCA tRNA nucleotidyltransferase [Patescibacteria group bacterium]